MKRAGKKPSEFVRFVVVSRDGQTWEVTRDNYEECPLFTNPDEPTAMLRQFVRNELGHKTDSGKAPAHISIMQRHQLVDYCDVSEKGHYKWYPNGVLMQRLILDYALKIAREWGAFEIKNPIVIQGDNNVVGELMGEFHERDYRVDGGRGICYLRYASDPLAFPFLQETRFTYKQTPVKIYEEASCFRNEQEGEVSGLKRVRGFLMSDMHAACASEEQARVEFEYLCLLFSELMNDIIAPRRWVLGWEGTIDFYENNKDWLIGLGKKMDVPAFFKLMPEMSHYYAMKNEYQCITADGANVQVSTVQWDVKDGERFDIGFIDDDGAKRPCPVIIHASSFGSIERTMCAILEKIAVDQSAGSLPEFPLWLTPTQVRLIPVSSEYVEFAEKIGRRLNDAYVRADIDDRNETVSKRVRQAETEWIPYVAVVGEKEADSSTLSIRARNPRQTLDLGVDELAQRIAEEVRGMPFRPLALPMLISKRPIFRG